ncbi:MAG: alpha/beta fold hydrolase [Geminicoccaceae bacterium]
MAELRLADGGRLHYELAGDGPPLLLVPGLGGIADFWGPIVPALAERFTVILHDHRGCGRSSLERIDFSIAQMAGDVLALLDHLGLERAHLVGHSTGGAIGQTIALDHPDRLDRLGLSGTWAAPDAWFQGLFASRSAILRTGGPALYLQSSALMLYPPWWIRDHPEILTVTEEAARARVPDPEVLLARIAAILRHDRAADLHRVTAPTLVIGARDDMVTPAYLSEDIGRLVGRSRTLILPDGGHFFPVTRAGQFVRAIVDFLDS